MRIIVTDDDLADMARACFHDLEIHKVSSGDALIEETRQGDLVIYRKGFERIKELQDPRNAILFWPY